MNLGIRLGQAFAALGLLTALFAAPAASAVEVAGFKFDESVKVNGQDLKLNGAGIRYKFVVKVYAAGLYIADKKTTTADVIAAPGAKRITLIMLREVGSDTMGQAFIDGIKKNSDLNERAKIVNQIVARTTPPGRCQPHGETSSSAAQAPPISGFAATTPRR